MKYLKISNDIEVEPNAFLLLGACTKHDDKSKIGYFGSGLKYAIAVLMRMGTEIAIFSGLTQIELSTVPESLRGQDFDVITINGSKTNLTTALGTDWKLWQAIREVYCNALDENECSVTQVECIEPIPGQTQFYIRLDGNEQLETVIRDWDKYFCADRTVHASCDYGSVMFPFAETVSLYRKGIRCYDSRRSALFDYNFPNIAITESRLVQYNFQIDENVARIWRACATPTMINKLAQNCRSGELDKLLEKDTQWSCGPSFNVKWLDYLRNKMVIPYEFAGHYTKELGDAETVVLPYRLVNQLLNCFGDEIKCPFTRLDSLYKFIVPKLSKRNKFLLDEVMRFFGEVAVEINHPIKVVIFENKRLVGLAHNGEILIAESTMELGKKKIATTIMEECFHLESGHNDETRDFQNYLINQMLTMLENTHGIFL